MTAALTPGTQRIGQAQQEFSERAKNRREELVSSGVRPFTVINFNPPPLRLEGELQRYSVPSPEDTRLPADVQRVTVPWNGRLFTGHALTIREPWIYGRMAGATNQGHMSEAIPQREVAEYLPVAIAYSFLEHFSPIFATGPDGQAAAPPTDARKIYGVMAFEGSLDEITEPKLTHTNLRKIRVPLAKFQTVGRSTRRSYTTVFYDFDEYLEKMFTGQLKYAKAVIERAQVKFSDGDQGMKEISSSDRLWYRWAIKQGYVPAPAPGEKTWLNELIDVDGFGSSQRLPVRKCQSCRKLEPELETPFCSCGSPIDTFTTFMAGHPVAEAYLQALSGDNRELALAEYRRRREGFDGFGAEPKKSGQPRVGGKFVKAGSEEIPASGTTTLPGED